MTDCISHDWGKTLESTEQELELDHCDTRCLWMRDCWTGRYVQNASFLAARLGIDNNMIVTEQRVDS